MNKITDPVGPSDPNLRHPYSNDASTPQPTNDGTAAPEQNDAERETEIEDAYEEAIADIEALVAYERQASHTAVVEALEEFAAKVKQVGVDRYKLHPKDTKAWIKKSISLEDVDHALADAIAQLSTEAGE